MRRRLPEVLATATALALALLSPPPAATTRGQSALAPPQPAAAPAKHHEATPPDALEDDDEVVRIRSNLIVVPVSVTDDKGRPIQGLGVSDFRLEEGGHDQAVEIVGNPELVPIHLALLLDVSSSVKKRFKFERKAASRFLQQVLRDVDTATIFTIGDEPNLLQARAGTVEAIAAVEGAVPSAEFTAFNDTLVDAAQHLAGSSLARHRRVVVALSDGVDTCSRRCTIPAYAAIVLQRADVTFYAINPSGRAYKDLDTIKRGHGHLEMLASATGGDAFYPDEVDDLEKFFRKITAELRSPYLLQYYSKVEAPRGTFVGVRVSVPARPKLRVHARNGYYVSGDWASK